MSVYKCCYPDSQIKVLCSLGDLFSDGGGGGVGRGGGLGWERLCQLSNVLIVSVSKYPAGPIFRNSAQKEKVEGRLRQHLFLLFLRLVTSALPGLPPCLDGDTRLVGDQGSFSASTVLIRDGQQNHSPCSSQGWSEGFLNRGTHGKSP